MKGLSFSLLAPVAVAGFFAPIAAAEPETTATCPRAGGLYSLPLPTCPRAIAGYPARRKTPNPSDDAAPAQPDPAAAAAELASQSWDGPHGCVGAYCVFANPNFGNGGIVLVTTKGNAKRVKALRPDTTTSQEKNAKRPFRAQAIPGKGVGLVAKRPIAKGELVMAETPAILVHKLALEEATDVYFPSLELAVSKMTAATRKSFMAQGTQGDFQGAMGIMDRLFTNSFQMALSGVGADAKAGFHYGNFPNVSKLNHDCRPNMVFHIDNNLVHRTHAVRDIKPGEELTISYVDQMDPARDRQARTRSSLGFVCGCAHCSLSAAEAAASERRIRRIKKLEVGLGRAVEGGFDEAEAKKKIAMVEELLGLYEVERLESKIAGAWMLAARVYDEAEDDKRAKKFAALAAKGLEMERGKSFPEVDSMKRLAQMS
ncbi:hypothetical protein MCOR02_006873 [Pyricularia oryzae]|nr:hypothetical protein MCOR02_006873 [Pyricularia oryzae]KAI6474366.1 hypothetical protein MCOR17_002172 [Pyricularia oryzae]